MSAEERCIVDYIGGANQGDEEATVDANQMLEAGCVNALGQFVVACEKCDADFVVIANVGCSPALLLNTPPSNRNIACIDVRSESESDWITNFGPWFNVWIVRPGK